MTRNERVKEKENMTDTDARGGIDFIAEGDEFAVQAHEGLRNCAWFERANADNSSIQEGINQFLFRNSS